VASLGFLASSYSLFATGIIWPALAYVYPHDEDVRGANTNPGVAFDLVTLGGIIVGMLVFGHLADKFGRKRLYGLELIIIFIATIGIAFSSDGFMFPASSNVPSQNVSKDYSYYRTMNVFDEVTTWRAVLGVGIGAGRHMQTAITCATPWLTILFCLSEYPMSAIIAAECLSTEWRGTIIAIVFSMQSLARLLAFGFANAFLEGQLKAMNLETSDTGYGMSLVVDKVWRFVAGFGGIFAIVAIGLRLTMPESPRYIPGIERQLQQAMAAESVNAAAVAPNPAGAAVDNQGGDHADGGQQQSDQTDTQTKWLVGAWRYLKNRDHRRRVAFVCTIWFLLDVCFYGTGLDSPSTLNLLWLNTSFQLNGTPPDYAEDPANITQSIYWVLDNNGARALEVSSISAMAGSLLMIPLINYFTRKTLLIYTSSIISALFFITAALVGTKFAQGDSIASLVFFALAQFTFNIGPNTIIFVLAAELFPTVFRGTFYGLAAACGKAGAMIIRPCVQLATSRIIHDTNPNQRQKALPLVIMLIVFGVLMMGIAVLAFLMPSSLLEVQRPRSETNSSWYERMVNKHLESIAPNPTPGELAPTENIPESQHNDQDSSQGNGSHNSDIPLNVLSGQNGHKAVQTGSDTGVNPGGIPP
jgi:PHS family inorganic phosphate transporter-like MFS transporter